MVEKIKIGDIVHRRRKFKVGNAYREIITFGEITEWRGTYMIIVLYSIDIVYN